jgi:WD40 repeat protein
MNRLMSCVPIHRSIVVVAVLASIVSVGIAEEPAPSAPYMVTFSPDGRRLAVATGKPESKVALTVWDTATLRRLWVERDRQGIPAVAFAPDGQMLAIGHFSDEAKVYDSIAEKLRATYGGHGTVARAVGFAQNGGLLAVGSYEGFIKLWNRTSGAEVRTLRGHNGRIYEVVFSPDGTRLL